MTAAARKIAVLFYNAVRYGMVYVDPGASSYETHYRARVVSNLRRRANSFGFVLQPLDPKVGAGTSTRGRRRRGSRSCQGTSRWGSCAP